LVVLTNENWLTEDEEYGFVRKPNTVTRAFLTAGAEVIRTGTALLSSGPLTDSQTVILKLNKKKFKII
jgi:hypothetical protein